MEQNIIELATELAHREVLKEMHQRGTSVYRDEQEEVLKYTDEAQEIFDKHYDEYYSVANEFMNT